MADLASILSGTDPMDPLILRASQQQQLLNSARDASQWQNQGPFGALARTIAGIRGGGENDALNQIVQQRAAAMPDVLKALASPNAYAYGAQNAGSISPTGLASIMAQAPAAARASLEGSQGALMRNELASYGALGGPATPAILKSPGLTPAPAAPAAAQPRLAPTAAGAGPSGPTQPAISEEMIQGAMPAAQAIVNYANNLPPGAQRGRALLGQPLAVQAAARRLLQQQQAAGAAQ